MHTHSNARAALHTYIHTAWVSARSGEETKELKRGWLTEYDMSKAYH